MPEVAKAAPVAASAALHSSPPVVPKQTVAPSGASMAAGDDVARIDSLPPTSPETVVASAARTLPEHRLHTPAVTTARKLREEAEQVAREEIDAEEVVRV